MEKENFWDELCGTNAFTSLGLTEINNESLKVFDKWYFSVYPYLYKYLPTAEELKGKNVLEIGLGFGTVSGYLMSHAKSFTGFDYAKNPVKMIIDRGVMLGMPDKVIGVQGDAKKMDLMSDNYDIVVSIGCLHHTGDTAASLREVYRVLKPGGRAVIMLYNKWSYRRLIHNRYTYYKKYIKNKLDRDYREFERGTYDANSKGESAPIVDFYSPLDIRKMMNNFKSISIRSENFDNYVKVDKKTGNQVLIPREKFLNNIARIAGLDLYIIAKK
jgi:ubiquinone/menaquinone biosynthesis C-methylase UbiE